MAFSCLVGRGLALRPAACCWLAAGWDKEAAGSSRGGQRQRGREAEEEAAGAETVRGGGEAEAA